MYYRGAHEAIIALRVLTIFFYFATVQTGKDGGKNIMSRTAEDDAHNAFAEAKENGQRPPGDADTHRLRSERAGQSRSMRKEVKRLRKERGGADFPEFDGGDF
ncbi:hypothetical protein C4585_02540 [Candidatus Parcubacteria bacterium]|nr:MAG: hypothetical protein C4585_02540 [Candidatus Parcubacteria bacterium]